MRYHHRRMQILGGIDFLCDLERANACVCMGQQDGRQPSTSAGGTWHPSGSVATAAEGFRPMAPCQEIQWAEFLCTGAGPVQAAYTGAQDPRPACTGVGNPWAGELVQVPALGNDWDRDGENPSRRNRTPTAYSAEQVNRLSRLSFVSILPKQVYPQGLSDFQHFICEDLRMNEGSAGIPGVESPLSPRQPMHTQ